MNREHACKIRLTPRRGDGNLVMGFARVWCQHFCWRVEMALNGCRRFFAKAGAWRQAVKDGKLIDMERHSYWIIARIVGIRGPLAITPAAFEQFVALSDTPAHRELVKEIRWGQILAALKGHHPPEDAREAIMEVNVVEPDGRLVTKSIKVTTGFDDGGREAFIFLLPDEAEPIHENS